MKKKAEKGITLIALIITIVVLLILAVVAIRAVQGDGIIRYAQNARDDYNTAMTNEQAILDSYLAQLEGNTNGNVEETKPAATWEQDGTTIYGKASDGTTVYTLAVGDTIAYNCYDKEAEEAGKLTYTATTTDTGNTASYVDYTGYPADGIDEEDKIYTITADVDLTWKALGVSDGKILITTEDGINPELILAGGRGYENSSTILNGACSIFGHGEFAEEGRSINKSDIMLITGSYMEASYGDIPSEHVFSNNTFIGENYSLGLNDSSFVDDKSFKTGNGSGHCYIVNVRFDSENIYLEATCLDTMWIDGGGDYYSKALTIRPVVTLESEIRLSKDANSVWQLGK